LTWVDDAPWGYAPFHYGRWVCRERMGWVPGPIAVRPVYAPALVAFVGGPRFSLSVSVATAAAAATWAVRWAREKSTCPRIEPAASMDRVNITNTTVTNTIITNVYNNQTTNVTYVNRSVRGGVTAVSRNTFANSQPVGRAGVVVNQQEVAAAPVGRRCGGAGAAADGGGVLVGTVGKDKASERTVHVHECAGLELEVAGVPVRIDPDEQFEPQPGQPLARTEVEGLRRDRACRQVLSGKRLQVEQSRQNPISQETGRPVSPPRSLHPPPSRVTANVGTAHGPHRETTPQRRNRREPATAPPASPPAAVETVRLPATTHHQRGIGRTAPAAASPIACCRSPPAAVETAAPPADNGRPDRLNVANREKAASTSRRTRRNPRNHAKSQEAVGEGAASRDGGRQARSGKTAAERATRLSI
jgi:hypothetical protein